MVSPEFESPEEAWDFWIHAYKMPNKIRQNMTAAQMRMLIKITTVDLRERKRHHKGKRGQIWNLWCFHEQVFIVQVSCLLVQSSRNLAKFDRTAGSSLCVVHTCKGQRYLGCRWALVLGCTDSLMMDFAGVQVLVHRWEQFKSSVGSIFPSSYFNIVFLFLPMQLLQLRLTYGVVQPAAAETSGRARKAHICLGYCFAWNDF